MRRTLALAVIASLAVAGLASAAEPDPIAVRQAGQDLLFGNFTGMRTTAAANGDITKMKEPAKAIARWMKVFPTEFPPGSDKGENTKALPAIWSDHAGFVKAADRLAAAADTLAGYAASRNREKFTAQLKVVGEACAACHKKYKAR
ncbi:MAG TPA: cytochrome c [Acetobacteraceae bacterium]|nr:cytochrome c [Acetobacteraceae bacterium]